MTSGFPGVIVSAVYGDTSAAYHGASSAQVVLAAGGSYGHAPKTGRTRRPSRSVATIQAVILPGHTVGRAGSG